MTVQKKRRHDFEIFPELHLFLPSSTAIAIDHVVTRSLAWFSEDDSLACLRTTLAGIPATKEKRNELPVPTVCACIDADAVSIATYAARSNRKSVGSIGRRHRWTVPARTVWWNRQPAAPAGRKLATVPGRAARDADAIPVPTYAARSNRKSVGAMGRGNCRTIPAGSVWWNRQPIAAAIRRSAAVPGRAA